VAALLGVFLNLMVHASVRSFCLLDEFVQALLPDRLAPSLQALQVVDQLAQERRVFVAAVVAQPMAGAATEPDRTSRPWRVQRVDALGTPRANEPDTSSSKSIDIAQHWDEIVTQRALATAIGRRIEQEDRIRVGNPVDGSYLLAML
jgi:hypothetical protein